MKRKGPQGFHVGLLLAVLVVPPRRPSIEVKDFDFVESKDRHRTVQIKARKADIYKPEDIVHLEAPRVLAWSASAKRPYEISGHTGVMNATSQDLEIHDSTTIQTPDGYEFKTKDLAYAARNKSLAGEDPVEVRPRGAIRRGASQMNMTGNGVRIALDKNLYEILRNVRAEQKMSAANTLVVRSRKAEISPENHVASFFREVTVRSAKLDLRGDSLVIHFENSVPRLLVLQSASPKDRIQALLNGMDIRSRGLEVNFDGAGEMLESQAIGDVDAKASDGTRLRSQRLRSDIADGKQRLRLEGKVTIETGTRVATCEQALYYPESGDILLEKIAAVRSGDQILEGERIRFSTRNSEVRVEGARGQVGRKQLGLR